MLPELIDDLLRPLSGRLGVRLRRGWYRRRLGACGARATIEPGVHFVGPRHIRLGDDCWIDRNAVLVAGPVRREAQVRWRGAPGDGAIRLGNGCHIGVGTIVQGHGGVSAGDHFTTSAGCRIYSLSNDVRGCRAGTVTIAGAASPRYVGGAISFGRNVWLGLDVKVVGGAVGDDVFARPGAVIAGDIPANSVVGGDPARPVGLRFAEQGR